MGSRVENGYKEYIRQGRDIAIALAMAHEDEKIRLRELNRPPVEIPTYVYKPPFVSDEDRGPIDEVTSDIYFPPEIEKNVSIEAPTAHAGAGVTVSEPEPEPEGFSDERLPGKVYRTAPALKAALTALAKREASAE